MRQKGRDNLLHFIIKQAMDEQVTEKLWQLRQLEAGWSENTQLPMAQKIWLDDQGRVPIGLSFPEYITGEKYSVLGSKCRLFAQDEAILARFNAAKWLARLSDYVHCTSICPVPEKLTGYAIYQREQPKTSKERLARRYAKRHNEDYDTAVLRYSEMTHKTIASPFIRLKSLSGDQEFCLWIKKTVVSNPLEGAYSSYGLSASATVPEF